jgi:hypothetical protein
MLRAPAGVCETCDLVRVAGTQEANETRPRFFMPMAHHVEPPRRLLPVNGDGASPESRDGATTKFPPPASPGEPRQKRGRKPDPTKCRKWKLGANGRCERCDGMLEQHPQKGPGRQPRAASATEQPIEATIDTLRKRILVEKEQCERKLAGMNHLLEALDDLETSLAK